MLKTKLFKSFALLVLIFGLLSTLIGARIIKSRVIDEALNRVRLDLNSAWSVYRSRLSELEIVVDLISREKTLNTACLTDEDSSELRNRLEVIRRNFGLDFLGLVQADGSVKFRTAPPYTSGDFMLTQPAVASALQGTARAGTDLFSSEQLKREAADLVEQAYTELQETKRARPIPVTVESRGLVMIAAAPVRNGSNVIGALYGGILLNRNEDIADRIKRLVYADEKYGDRSIGSATIFLKDSRIATTVQLANGNRAIGTRASKEVADSVLDNGKSWLGRAFVVNEWYLTAYDPIRDFDDKVIGMLYVGILEKPFRDIEKAVLLRYAGLLIGGLIGALILAFMFAGQLSTPIHQLVEATQSVQRGNRHKPITCNKACDETTQLVDSFNKMAATLQEREDKLATANDSLTALNRSYMDMLGFVSHELKTPVASILNYGFLLRQEKVGPLNEKQLKAVHNIESNSHRIVEMVRHYLNLSRIENGELQPILTEVHINKEVITPLLTSSEHDLERKGCRVENLIDPELVLKVDLNMMREVFENLISNAIKYGREGALIRLSAETENNWVRFKAFNEGEGIPEDKLDLVFKKFSRIDGVATRGQKGTGLGLFITQHIITAHGGTIAVASKPGEWVEFTFTLPLAPTA